MLSEHKYKDRVIEIACSSGMVEEFSQQIMRLCENLDYTAISSCVDGTWSVGVAVISSAFHAEEHQFESGTDYGYILIGGYMDELQKITVNYLLTNTHEKKFQIVPLKIHRDWMNKTQEKFAYKCLPLNVANQYGWAVVSPCDFKVSWYGGTHEENVEVFDIPDEYSACIQSHFGDATFTINPDFIIQTPENYSIYIRGIPNKEYGILKPLDAIVETDWLPFTFTYNFKFMESGIYEFKKGDLLFCFFPILRNTVENFEIISQNIEENPQLNNDFKEFATARQDALNKRGLQPYGFQRFYADGRGPNKVYNITNHIKKLFFKEVKDKD